MDLSIKIKGLRPISLNRLHYRNRKLTQEARVYRGKFLQQLQAYSNELKALSKAFVPTDHMISLSLHFYMPQSEFYTHKGYISARSQDLDNLLKLIIDCLCNAEYNTPKWLTKKKRTIKEKYLYEDLHLIQNLDIDDKFITSLNTKKLPHDLTYHEVLIVVEIKKHT